MKLSTSNKIFTDNYFSRPLIVESVLLLHFSESRKRCRYFTKIANF